MHQASFRPLASTGRRYAAKNNVFAVAHYHIIFHHVAPPLMQALGLTYLNNGNVMRLLTVILVLLLSSNLYASEAGKKEKLTDLVYIRDMDSMMDGMYSQMESMMQGLSKQMNIKPSEQPIFDKYYQEMTLVMREEMSWSTMQPLVLDIYDRNFTEQEIDDMLAFYRTPTGQSLLKKMPNIMQESMVMSQQLMKGTLPKIQALSMQLAEELKDARAQN